MQPLISNLTFEQLRQAKKNASKSLKALGIDLMTSSTIGNHVANVFGYRDWNTAKALIEKMPIPAKNNLKHTTPYERLKETISDDYVDDVFLVYSKSENISFAFRVGKLAEYLEREPSILSRSINFEKAYGLADEAYFENSEQLKNRIIGLINEGLNKTSQSIKS